MSISLTIQILGLFVTLQNVWSACHFYFKE